MARGPRLGPSCLRVVWLGARRTCSQVVSAAFGLMEVLYAESGKDEKGANKSNSQRDRWVEGDSEMGLGLGRETRRDRERQRLR